MSVPQFSPSDTPSNLTPGQVKVMPLLLVALTLILGTVIAILTWYGALPFLPPVAQAKDVVDPSEIAVGSILIPGVIHSLIASLLFLTAALTLATVSGGQFLAQQAAQMRNRDGQDPRLALARRRGRTRLGLGDRPMGDLLMVAASMLLLIAYAGLLSYLQYRSIDDFFGAVFRAGFGWRLAAFLVFGLLAPVAEELLFRGWLWTALRQSWPASTCSFVTGILWAGTHVTEGTIKVAVLLPVGLLLGFVRGRSASVRAPVLLHLALNLGSLTAPFLLQPLFT